MYKSLGFMLSGKYASVPSHTSSSHGWEFQSSHVFTNICYGQSFTIRPSFCVCVCVCVCACTCVCMCFKTQQCSCLLASFLQKGSVCLGLQGTMLGYACCPREIINSICSSPPKCPGVHDKISDSSTCSPGGHGPGLSFHIHKGPSGCSVQQIFL